MKKFFVLFAAIILAFSLAACGSDETPDTGETNAETSAGEQPGDETGDKPVNGLPEGIASDDYVKFVQFDLPENFREAAVAQMRKQAAVEWTPEYTFTYGNKFDNWGYEKTYEAGKKYTGLPYGAMNSSIEEFQKYLDEHRGRYAVKTDEGYYGVMGTQCNTAINLSLQQFYPAACEDSGGYWPAYEKFIGIKVGDYAVPEGAKKGLDIMSANGDQKMYESYALANAGDVIMGKNDETGVTHVRMVAAEAVVVRNGTGQINGNRSYLVCVEQTDSWDSTQKRYQYHLVDGS